MDGQKRRSGVSTEHKASDHMSVSSSASLCGNLRAEAWTCRQQTQLTTDCEMTDSECVQFTGHVVVINLWLGLWTSRGSRVSLLGLCGSGRHRLSVSISTLSDRNTYTWRVMRNWRRADFITSGLSSSFLDCRVQTCSYVPDWSELVRLSVSSSCIYWTLYLNISPAETNWTHQRPEYVCSILTGLGSLYAADPWM